MPYYSPEGVHKYTINLPSEMYQQAKKKAQSVGIYSVSIYFRAILIRELKKELSSDEIISGRRESEVTDSARHRRIRLNNISNTGFKVNVKKFIDKLRGQQYIEW